MKITMTCSPRWAERCSRAAVLFRAHTLRMFPDGVARSDSVVEAVGMPAGEVIIETWGSSRHIYVKQSIRKPPEEETP